MKEVSGSQWGWGPAKKPGGESKRGGQVGGGKKRKKNRETWWIDPLLYCHQEFISSWKGVKEGWKGQRWRMKSALHSQRPWQPPPCLSTCTSPPPTLVSHPALSTSSTLLYLCLPSFRLPPPFIPLFSYPPSGICLLWSLYTFLVLVSDICSGEETTSKNMI